MNPPEAKFRINIKKGIVEIEGSNTFVERHLEKFEDVCKSAIQEVVAKRISNIRKANGKYPLEKDHQQYELMMMANPHPLKAASKHVNRQHSAHPPIPVDLKGNRNKIGLREFYDQKRPLTYYEKTVVFVYYLTKFNKQSEVKLGEILSCFDEVEERKPSIIDTVKNSIRYKGWLGQGSDKFSTVLTISGENFVGFDLPKRKENVLNVLEQANM